MQLSPAFCGTIPYGSVSGCSGDQSQLRRSKEKDRERSIEKPYGFTRGSAPEYSAPESELDDERALVPVRVGTSAQGEGEDSGVDIV